MEKLDVDTLWLPKLLSAEDLRGSINTIAKELEKTAIAAEIIDKLDTQLEDASVRAQQWSNRVPKVLFLLEPPGPTNSGMGGGLNSKADTLIQLAGGQNAAHAFQGFKPISAESLVSMNPDLILVGQSDNHGGSPQSINAMMTSAALSGVNAITHGAVHAVPLDDLAFGPRLGEAVLRWNKHIGKISKLD
jgi:iron complex transport system substrate-binding protein